MAVGRKRSLPYWRLFPVALLLCMQSLPATAEEVRLAIARTPLTLPFYIAREQGYFRDEQLNIRFMEVAGGHRALQMLLDGQADLATCSDSALMYNSLGGSQIATLGYFASSQADLAVVGNPDLDSLAPTQWRGQRLGVIKRSSSEYLLHTWLLYKNIDARNLELVPLQPEDMSQALKDRRVSAVVSWEPFTFQILRQNPQSRLLDNPGLHTLTFHLVHPRRAALSQVYVKVLRALARAEEFVALNPHHAQSILRQELQVEQDFVDWIWPRYIFQLGLDQALITSLERQAQWARQQDGAHPAVLPNYLEFINSRPLRQVMPDAVSLVE